MQFKMVCSCVCLGRSGNSGDSNGVSFVGDVLLGYWEDVRAL